MSKLIMQDIADSLSISRISVWKALNNRPGVSNSLREKVFKKAVETGYLRNSPYSANYVEPSASTRTVAAVVSRPESSLFWMQIIHQIAKELSIQGVNLMYTYLPTYYQEGYTLPPVLSDGSLSGIIVLNVYSEPILKRLADLSLPKVFLDSVPAVPFGQLNGSLVLLEGRLTVKEITGRLLDSGRQRLGFVGDVNYAQTNKERYLGFLDAFLERGVKRDETLSMTEPLHLATHYEQISGFLSSLKTMPDGFVCASDYIAHFIEQYFTEHEIPRNNISLTGFDNNLEYSNIANRITTVNVQTRTMGERLADKILFAMNHTGASHELCYVTSNILYRSSTPE